MLFKHFGNKALPTVVIVHAGGLSWWAWQSVIDVLQEHYHVIAPVIDGHGEDFNTTFISIEDSANKLLNYIKQACGGSVHAVIGLSIGGQITVELMSQSPNITDYAVVDSALLYPITSLLKWLMPVYRLAHGLIQYPWFSKMQAKALKLPASMLDHYYEDSVKMTKASFSNMMLSNAQYALKESVVHTCSKVFIMVGQRELSIMLKSSKYLHDTLKESYLYIVPKMKHGEFSIRQPKAYADTILKWIS